MHLAFPGATRRTSHGKQDLSIWLNATPQVHGQKASSIVIAEALKPSSVAWTMTSQPFAVPNPNCVGRRYRVMVFGHRGQQGFRCETRHRHWVSANNDDSHRFAFSLFSPSFFLNSISPLISISLTIYISSHFYLSSSFSSTSSSLVSFCSFSFLFSSLCFSM